MESILTDVRYALKQLAEAKRKLYTGQGNMDELRRAEDALERVEEALEREKEARIGAETVDLAEVEAWTTEEILAREA